MTRPGGLSEQRHAQRVYLFVNKPIVALRFFLGTSIFQSNWEPFHPA